MIQEYSKLISLQSTEPLLTKSGDSVESYALIVKNAKLWELYEQHFSVFWSPHEIETNKDQGQWDQLSSPEQHFISRVLAFFATADGIVFENIKVNFESEVCLQEAKFFYGFQGMIENVHSQVYMNLLKAYVKDKGEQDTLIRAVQEIPSIKNKARWAIKHFDSDTIPFCIRLIAFACVEGIFFSGAFCSIFWLKQHKRGLLEALTFSNQLISRDEGLHTEFAVALFHELENKPSEGVVHEVVRSAVDLEREFTCDALEIELIQMNKESMQQYIEFVADRLLNQLGYTKIYNASNPYPWMELQSLRVSTNFFENKVSEYSLAPNGEISLDCEF
tara:strand:- start:1389 stop:2387 length:999 start_codon:yes stop_codon:yes gene_type:complete